MDRVTQSVQNGRNLAYQLQALIEKLTQIASSKLLAQTHTIGAAAQARAGASAGGAGTTRRSGGRERMVDGNIEGEIEMNAGTQSTGSR